MKKLMGLVLLILLYLIPNVNAECGVYDNFSSGILDNNNWDEIGVFDEHCVENGVYHTAQLNMGDAMTGIVFKDIIFRHGDIIEYDVNYINGTGNRVSAMILNGVWNNNAFLGRWNSDINSDYGVYHIKITFLNEGVYGEFNIPNGNVFTHLWNFPLEEYIFGVVTYTGDNGIVHMDYDNFIFCENCTQNWICSNWSSCVRKCTDLNTCYYKTEKPAEYNPNMTNIINTTWTAWTNISCLPDDTMNQIRNTTEYDNNFCGLVSNTTHYEYRDIICDYCTPNWNCSNWTTCINRTQNRTCIDLNICEEEAEKPMEIHNCTIYVCNKDVYNCNNFTTQEEAQIIFDYCGGIDNDIHRLDGDNDGIPCESLVIDIPVIKSSKSSGRRSRYISPPVIRFINTTNVTINETINDSVKKNLEIINDTIIEPEILDEIIEELEIVEELKIVEPKIPEEKTLLDRIKEFFMKLWKLLI